MADRTDDLTARARIREAATAEIAERGAAHATIRRIAERAGVSPALVQHHFGTKDRLRAACDEYVLDYLRREAGTGIGDGRVGDGDYVAHVYDSSPAIMRYLARGLVDGSAAAAQTFDEMVRITGKYLSDRPGYSDAHTRAVVYTAMRLGVTVLHEHVARGLGQDVFTGEAAPRIGRATLDITAPELLPDGLADRVLAGIEDYAHHERNRNEES